MSHSIQIRVLHDLYKTDSLCFHQKNLMDFGPKGTKKDHFMQPNGDPFFDTSGSSREKLNQSAIEL